MLPDTLTHTLIRTLQLANISKKSDTMISGLKQAVSKDGGVLGTPSLLVSFFFVIGIVYTCVMNHAPHCPIFDDTALFV